jgi:hypothetical protein
MTLDKDIITATTDMMMIEIPSSFGDIGMEVIDQQEIVIPIGVTKKGKQSIHGEIEIMEGLHTINPRENMNGNMEMMREEKNKVEIGQK